MKGAYKIGYDDFESGFDPDHFNPYIKFGVPYEDYIDGWNARKKEHEEEELEKAIHGDMKQKEFDSLAYNCPWQNSKNNSLDTCYASGMECRIDNCAVFHFLFCR
jgi:hypothetical protein